MSQYPANVVEVLLEHLSAMEDVKGVVGRPIRPTDGDGLLSVYAGEWTAEEYEIGTPSAEPTIQNYTLFVQFTTAGGGDEAELRARHAEISRKIRAMLYRDDDLRVALRQLSETLDDVVERFMKCEVLRQRFFGNQLQGVFRFLSHLDLKVQTTI